jgi:hypothetical protein
MPGPAPKFARRRRNVPERGEWQPTVGIGWQGDEWPKCPSNLKPATRRTWEVWFSSWFASHWTEDDLPMLELIARLYDKCVTDQASASEQNQFRQLADSYGITPKGQQDRRWQPPKEEPAPVVDTETTFASRYGHLRAVGED